MSDEELIGGGIVGGIIGYNAGFNKGHKQGYSEGYQQANFEKERENTFLKNEIIRLQEQIKQNHKPMISSDILKFKTKPFRKLDMKKVKELLEKKKKLYSKS